MDGGEGVAAGFFETPSSIPYTETGACNAAGARPRFVRCNGIQRALAIDQMTARNSKTREGDQVITLDLTMSIIRLITFSGFMFDGDAGMCGRLLLTSFSRLMREDRYLTHKYIYPHPVKI